MMRALALPRARTGARVHFVRNLNAEEILVRALVTLAAGEVESFVASGRNG
jgi:hypothetical protein